MLAGCERGGGVSWGSSLRWPLLADSLCGRKIPKDHLQTDRREGQKGIERKKNPMYSLEREHHLPRHLQHPGILGTWELGL